MVLRTFGFTVAYKNSKEPPTYFVRLGESLIELIPPSEAARQSRESADPRLSHMGISVVDFDAAVEDLAGKGMTVGNVREASGGVTVGWLDYPEGNQLQVSMRLEKL